MKLVFNPITGTLDYVLSDTDLWVLPPVEDWHDPTGGLPADPSVGDRYISEATANGWTTDYIYEWDGSEWVEYPPEEGWMVWMLFSLIFYVFFSGGWMETGDTSYLRLDASNDPVTGDLLLTPTADSTTVLQVTQADSTVVFNVDTTNKRVGINNAAPQSELHMYKPNSTPAIWMSRIDASISAGNSLGLIYFGGTGGNNESIQAQIGAVTELQSWTSTKAPTSLAFSTTKTDSRTLAEKMRLHANGQLTIGATVAIGKLGVVGDKDEIQAVIQANATQTANVLEQQQSDTTVVIYTTNTGSLKISDKLIFTQTDGNEYIDSLADGYMDYRATTGHRFGDGTNQTVFAADGSQSFAGTARIDWTKITADNITQGAGNHSGTTGGGGGLVGDIAVAHDGNFYHIDEVGANPGFELTVEFISVVAFNWVQIIASYDGGATHPACISMWNFNTTTWDAYNAFASSQAEVSTPGDYTLQDMSFFVPSDTNYIGTGADAGDVRVRFCHPASGNANHDLDIDVVAIYQ